VEKLEPSYAVGRNVNWYSSFGKAVWQYPKNQTWLLCDTAIPLLGIYLREMKTYNHTNTYEWIEAFRTTLLIRDKM
jgi:hypothetical protein